MGQQVYNLRLKMNLTEQEIERYSRNIILPEIGGAGQKKLLASKVLIIGIGGLGSPVLMYLAASGVGNITIVDNDKVDLSNLQRQVIHNTSEIGNTKVSSAKKFIKNINPAINIIEINDKITERNVEELIKKNHIVADGSDNFKTRYLVSDACFRLNKTLVSAAITKFEGQISTWKKSPIALPCFRCLFPKEPDNSELNNCSANGVLGSVAGFLGSIQATEVVKEILGIGKSLAGFLNIYDLLNNNFRTLKINKDPNCSFCSKEN